MSFRHDVRIFCFARLIVDLFGLLGIMLRALLAIVVLAKKQLFGPDNHFRAL